MVTEFKTNPNPKPEGCEFNIDTQEWEAIKKAESPAQEKKKPE